MGYPDHTYAVLNKSLSWQMCYRVLSFEAGTASSGPLTGASAAFSQAFGVAKTPAPASIREGQGRTCLRPKITQAVKNR